MSETPFHRSDARDEGERATVRPHWLSVPVLEAALGEMNKQSVGLDVLRAAVASIVETLNRRVTIEIYEKVVTFSYPGLIFHNVSMKGGEYHVLFQHEAAQMTRIYGYTDELAWRICNYPCSPSEMREARKKAESQGITNKILPASFFRPRRKTSDAQDASHQS